jgi:hypothetical protein
VCIRIGKLTSNKNSDLNIGVFVVYGKHTTRDGQGIPPEKLVVSSSWDAHGFGLGMIGLRMPRKLFNRG